jgi:hypothetical protein
VSKHLSVIFCDDIRHELGGKISLMGCYSEIMYVPDFPITLPKLCVHSTLEMPADAPFKNVTMSLKKGSIEIAGYEINNNPEGVRESEMSDQPAKAHLLIGGFTMPSFVIDEETILEVSALVDGEFIVGKRLIIKKAP